MAKEKMRALLKESNSVAVSTVAYPAIGEQDVLVRVELAGLCRTDVYAAQGKIETANPLILGHEFSGVVAEIGASVDRLKSGQRVTVNPLLPCGGCQYCLSDRRNICQHTKFLGVDRNGCFAGFASVPASSIYVLPDSVSFQAAAYAEPVAASLAVLKTGIQRSEKGLIYGKNRFSQLMHKILRVYGFNSVDVCDQEEGIEIQNDTYDFVIETMVTSAMLVDMLRLIRPGGKIVLKSRMHEPITLKLNEAISKEPVLHVVNYGSFQEGLALLADNRIVVDDLIDGVYKLDEFQQVFSRAKQKELLKPFFSPWAD